jgi:NADP-reducing hydrogenase subunit HndB
MAEKINSPEALRALRDKTRSEIDLRTGDKDIRITVHMGTCGIAAGARDVLGFLTDELAKAAVSNVTLRQSGCAGLCDHEPMITLSDKGGKDYTYGKLDKRKVVEIVRQHVLAGLPVADCVIK